MPEVPKTEPSRDAKDIWRTVPGGPLPEVPNDTDTEGNTPPADGNGAEFPTGREHRPFWKELPVLVVVAFVIALLLKSFVIQAFFIPSASMEPTLMVGDRVLVQKISTRFGDPHRGDVVVFEKDLGAAAELVDEESVFEKVGDAFRELFGFPTDGQQDFIKRVMAVEGDTIEARDGQVFVNGEPVMEPYLPEGVTTSDFGPVDIPTDMIFVMGDNRGNSDDSRSFGPVPVDTVVGKAFLLIWPPSTFGLV